MNTEYLTRTQERTLKFKQRSAKNEVGKYVNNEINNSYVEEKQQNKISRKN